MSAIHMRIVRSVSILALREKGDFRFPTDDELARFQSSPFVRRATVAWCETADEYGVSILALREKGDAAGDEGRRAMEVSILALREKGDQL